MYKVKYFCLFFLISLVFQSCEYDNIEQNPVNFIRLPEDINNELFKQENYGPSTTRNFIGVVKDEAGNRLVDAKIKIGDNQNVIFNVKTDQNGVFVANDVDVYEKFAYILVRKSGYIYGSASVIPFKNGVYQMEQV